MSSPWPGLDDKLRVLWADLTLSTAEIGRRMGISKSSAVGRAHRIELPGRESPIRPKREGAEPAPPRDKSALGGPSLPPLASLASELSLSENGPRAAWLAWCGKLTPAAFNTMRRAQHKHGCPVWHQRTTLRLWECTCGVSQPPSDGAPVIEAPPAISLRDVSSPRPGQTVPVIVVPDLAVVSVVEPVRAQAPRKSRLCCYPEGDIRTKTFRYCDAPIDPEQPRRVNYCIVHVAACYARSPKNVGDRLDESAR